LKKLISTVLLLSMLLAMMPIANAYTTIYNGTYGEDVKTLQIMLNAVQKSGLKVDGICGESTMAAVKIFQTANSLTADGICGPATWKKLTEAYVEKTAEDQIDLRQDLEKYVGKNVANPNKLYQKNGDRSYNPYTMRTDSNGKLQCVGYVYARLEDKLDVTPGFHSGAGAKDIPANAKAVDGKTVTSYSTGMTYTMRVYTDDNGKNIAANSFVSFLSSTSSYGHVIYVEEVRDGYVYYTEGGGGWSSVANGAGILKKMEYSAFVNKAPYVGTVVFERNAAEKTPCDIHTWDAGTITLKATESSTGEKRYTCLHCGENRTVILQKLESQHGTLDQFEEVDSYADQFSDIRKEDWYYPNVVQAYNLGIMRGSSLTFFNVSGNLSIAESITIACRLHSIFYTGQETFVQTGTVWYKVYVDYAVSNGIIEEQDFADYTRYVSRAEFAKILAAAFPKEALPEINFVEFGDIPDVSGNEAYANAVYLLYRAGVLTGSDAAGTFKPHSNISRAEACAVVTRMASPSLRIKKNLTGNSLIIGSGNYNPGTVTRGNSYSFNGCVTSNYSITSLTVGIYHADETPTAQVKKISPNTKSYDIHTLDNDIRFGVLPVGEYKFRVIAEDASGATKTLVDSSFYVIEKYEHPDVLKLREEALNAWVVPVKASYYQVEGTGRAFGAYRTATRQHAAIDYVVSNGAGTPVYAMQAGKVVEVVQNFYYGTSAIAVQHNDGSIARYCEIGSTLRVGDTVKQGQQIATIKANTYDGGTMLHLELYLGTAAGGLSATANSQYDYVDGSYNRRRDLVDPTFLLQLKK